MPTNLERIRVFVKNMTALVEKSGDDEPTVIAEGSKLLSDLVSTDDWLPDEFAQPHPDHYKQYLLYCDPLERFSMISAVWGPGHGVPPHDHMVWGLVGQLRGSETAENFSVPVPGNPLASIGETSLLPGQVVAVSPNIGDVHAVRNASETQTSISIHVYGGNIGSVERHMFDSGTGEAKTFISAYDNPVIPNIWDRSVAEAA